MAKRTAVIDIGSNSVRMVIFEKTSRFAFHLLYETKSRVRISEKAYENGGNLQEAAMKRALDALRGFLSIADSYHVRKTLCCATSAVRDAGNRSLFVKRVKDELGLSIKVIDGEKEAYLGGIAAANLLPRLEGHTIDIGGGSTEIAAVAEGTVTQTYSLDLGTVRLKELFFDHGDVKGATEYIDNALAALPMDASPVLIGVGGTFRALAQAIMAQSGYPLKKLHGFCFEASVLEAFCEKILASDEAGFKSLGIKKERYDVIKPGVLIVLRFLARYAPQKLVTSGAGVREGLFLHDLLRHAKHTFPNNFNPSVRYLLDTHTIEPRHAEQMAATAKKLFSALHSFLDIPSTYAYELDIAAKLAQSGTALHFYSYQRHSYYLAQSVLEYGFTHQQIMLISTLLRYQKRKRLSKSFKEKYGTLLPDDKIIDALTFILFISNILLSHRPRNIDFALSFDTDTLSITAKEKQFYLAKEQLKNITLPKNLKLSLNLS